MMSMNSEDVKIPITLCVCVCVCTQSCLTLCDPMDYSLPASSAHGISQARILEWAAISSSGDLPDPGIKPVSSAVVGRIFTTEQPGMPHFSIQSELKGTVENDNSLIRNIGRH